MEFNDRYYQSIISFYNYDPIEVDMVNFSIGEMDKSELLSQWLCHYQGKEFAKKFHQGKKCIVTTGFGLSGPPHIGTISQIMKAIRLQRKRIPVQIVLGDLDAVNGKSIDYSYTQELVGKYRDFIINLGFKEEQGSILRSQSEMLGVLKTAYLIGHEIDDEMFENTEEDLHEFYSKRGKVDPTMSYRRKLSLNLMIADFIDLFWDGYKAVLVYLGIDEHRYVLMANKVLDRIKKNNGYSNVCLSSMYSPIIKGFNGYPKMSKSFPESGINVNTNPDKVMSMILDEKGSVDPEENVVCQMLSSVSYFSIAEISSAWQSCKENNGDWVKWKRSYAEQLIDILDKWNIN
jgi:tryptophanyl-tRNA synthetase